MDYQGIFKIILAQPTMDDEFDDYREVFSQDGVLLRQAPSAFISFINAIGTLYIYETIDNEGKPNKIIFKGCLVSSIMS